MCVLGAGDVAVRWVATSVSYLYISRLRERISNVYPYILICLYKCLCSLIMTVVIYGYSYLGVDLEPGLQLPLNHGYVFVFVSRSAYAVCHSGLTPNRR